MARRITTRDLERLLQETGAGPSSRDIRGPDCLTLEEFVAFCEGESADQEHERVVAHLGACPACLEELCLCLAELEMSEAEGLSSAEGTSLPATVPGCVPVLDLYKDVLGVASISEEQKRHLTSCKSCTELRGRIVRVLEREDLPQQEMAQQIASLVREFVEQWQPGLTQYVEVVNTLVRQLVSGPQGTHPDLWRTRRGSLPVGALAASGLPDSQQLALLASALTIAAVAIKTSDARARRDYEHLRKMIHTFGRKFGAGRELALALVDFLSQRVDTSGGPPGQQ